MSQRSHALCAHIPPCSFQTVAQDIEAERVQGNHDNITHHMRLCLSMMLACERAISIAIASATGLEVGGQGAADLGGHVVVKQVLEDD